MSTLRHLKLDIRGCLLNWSDRDMHGIFQDDDGRTLPDREAKNLLIDELAKGHRFLACGHCEGFDPQTGCPGHPMPETDSTERA